MHVLSLTVSEKRCDTETVLPHWKPVRVIGQTFQQPECERFITSVDKVIVEGAHGTRSILVHRKVRS
jgi:hypothetical protein